MATQHQLIGWTQEEWNNLKNLAKQEINQMRKVNNLLPHQNIAKGIRQVRSEEINRIGKEIIINDSAPISLIELSSSFQIDAKDKYAVKLAIKYAALAFGKAMDILLLNGAAKTKNAAPVVPGSVKWPANCKIRLDSRNKGLNDYDEITIEETLGPEQNELEYPHSLIAGIIEAKSKLQANDNEGPYILILSPRQYHAAMFPSENFQLPIRAIEGLINGTNTGEALSEGIIIESSGLDASEAILLSPVHIDVCWNYDGDIQITDPGEPVHARLFGAFALRINDPSAVVKIIYKIKKRISKSNLHNLIKLFFAK